MALQLAPAFDDVDDLSLSLPAPGSLSSPNEILAALRQLEAEEAAIDAQLAAMVNDRLVLDTLLDRIDSVQPVLEQVQLEAGELARRVDETADVAERISGKVRQLDLEQSRVTDAIDMVQAVQDLKTSLSALAASVEKRDWESATRNMQRAMGVDKAILTSGFAEAVVPTGDLPLPPSETIAEFRSTLLTIFTREFEKASSERDEANTSRFFKLFPMIAAEREGLDEYAKFVCSIVSGRSKGSLQHQASSPTFFASLLTPLFEQIAHIISQHQPVVEKYYGAGRMLPVAGKLQEECDKQAGQILAQWEEERRVARKLQETQRYRYPQLAALAQPAASAQSGQPAAVAALKRPYQQLSRQGTQSQLPTTAGAGAASATENEAIDPRDIDAVLTELSQMSGRWQLYRRFMYGRLHSEQDAPGPTKRLLASPNLPESPITNFHVGTPAVNGSDGLFGAQPAASTEASLSVVEDSAFCAKLQENLGEVYEPLELWYLRSSIERAHSLDEPDYSNKPYLSSSLDDTFFILKKVLLRLVTSANLRTHLHMCSQIKEAMDRDFGDILRKRMDAVWSNLTGVAANARAKEEDKARNSFIVYANDLVTAADYIGRVIEEIVESDSLSQSYFLNSEHEQAMAAVEDIKSLQQRYRASLKSGLDSLFNQLVRPRLRTLLSDCYKDVSYTLDEDSYAEAEYSDIVRKRFVKAWDALMEPYREPFTSANYSTVFTLSVGVLARLWESQIRSMRFTELGALRLDKDIRSVTGFLNTAQSAAIGTVRESFARLQHIGALLSVETAEDAQELASSTSWKLSQQDTNAFLALRM